MDIREWLAAAGDLLLGAVCPGCDRAGWGICAGCRAAVSARACYLTEPDPTPPGFPPTAAAGPYDAIVRQLIIAHKEDQALTLTPFLAERLAAAVAHLVLAQQMQILAPTTLALVPVPSSPSAVRRRGFDATWALARRAARLIRRANRVIGDLSGIPQPVVHPVRMLTQSRRIQDQAGLGAEARSQNLANGFRVITSQSANSTVVVIVDDVVTTGSSLTEAARALRGVGVTVLGAATVGATVRFRPSRPTGA